MDDTLSTPESVHDNIAQPIVESIVVENPLKRSKCEPIIGYQLKCWKRKVIVGTMIKWITCRPDDEKAEAEPPTEKYMRITGFTLCEMEGAPVVQDPSCNDRMYVARLCK